MFLLLICSSGDFRKWSASDFTFAKGRPGVLGNRVVIDPEHRVQDLVCSYHFGNEDEAAWNALNQFTKEVTPSFDHVDHIEISDQVKGGATSFASVFHAARLVADYRHKQEKLKGDAATHFRALHTQTTIADFNAYLRRYSSLLTICFSPPLE